jgi:hypothetical protein
MIANKRERDRAAGDGGINSTLGGCFDSPDASHSIRGEKRWPGAPPVVSANIEVRGRVEKLPRART